MASCCQEMSARLNAARNDTTELIRRTSTLQGEKDLLDLKRDVLAAFLHRFQLSAEETYALSDAEPVSKEFFTALSRVQSIHKDCRLLLTGEHQNAGLTIMEAMAAEQEASFEKLYRWTQCKLFLCHLCTYFCICFFRSWFLLLL